jgi:hypothetical protein
VFQFNAALPLRSCKSQGKDFAIKKNKRFHLRRRNGGGLFAAPDVLPLTASISSRRAKEEHNKILKP